MSDEGFREIQLNGKQLIFLFMAVTVVLVVTFLFGVLVGRGVREGAGTGEIVSNEIASDPAVAPVADNAPSASPAAGSPSPAPAAPAAEELSYADRLLRDTAPEERLKLSADKPAPAQAPAPVVQEPVVPKAAAAPPPPPAPAPPPVKESTPTPTPAPKAPATPVASAKPAVQPTSVPASGPVAQASDPSGPGIAVQVAAYRDRKDADTLAKQLAAKGYPAFVMDPVKGTSTPFFRVRVGKYKTLKDAEAVQTRLQSAEQLTNAWIAR